MARWCYSLFYYLITPLVLLRLYYRGCKAPAYRLRIAERFGFFNSPELSGCIWLHAVSVGETIAAAPLVRQLQQRYPRLPIVITTMTPTGSDRVTALFGDSVYHVYAPYDLPGAIDRFLNRIEPAVLLIIETELWPNTVQACYQRQIPVLLANARLSEKSASGYQRFAALSGPMLQSLSLVAAQTAADAKRFVALGLPAEAVAVTGSIKFDISIDEFLQQQVATLKQQWSMAGQRPLWIAASTHAGEDEILLAAHRLLLAELPKALLILVPRHPERFQTVAELCQTKGFKTLARSSHQAPDQATEVYLGDTMGEMMLLLGAADIAFVGGSLIASGGHNLLEPAAWGMPIITGDSDFNFLEISRLLQQEGALTKAHDANAIAQCLQQLWQAPAILAQQGWAAREVVAANRGSLQRLLALLSPYLDK